MYLEPDPAKANKTTARLADFAAGGTNDLYVLSCVSAEYRSQRLLGASLVTSLSEEYSTGGSASCVVAGSIYSLRYLLRLPIVG